MDDCIKAIRSSVVDGIAWTPRYRERQLASLHGALLASRENVIRLVCVEGSLTQEEATVQFLLTAQALKTFHSSVHPERCMAEEYLIAQGKDNKARRSPYGYAYIVPSQYDLLYSSIVPVAAAIAAGNCVVLEVQQTTSDLTAALRTLLLKGLSTQIFAIVSQDPFSIDFRTRYCITLSGLQTSQALTSTEKIQTSASRVIALVDRSANIKAAASACVKARFAFGGTSAYAPDVVFVNEFVVQDFCSAASQSGLQYLSGNANGKVPNGTTMGPKRYATNSTLKQLQQSSAEILVSGDRGTVAILRHRDSHLLSTKLDSPLLLVVPITSMDDAIDHLAKNDQSLRALYLFSAPAAAKYLGQFIASSITIVNHVPVELLVGSPAPLGHATSIQPRYTADMFSRAQPELIEASSLTRNLSTLMSREASVKDKKAAEAALNVTIERVKEAYGPPIGFFEQGILFGLSCVLATAVAAGVIVARYGGPAVMSRLRIR